MPIKEENKGRYPANWKEISEDIRYNRAKNKCEFCGAENYKPHPITKSIVYLTVAHLNDTPEDCRPENLAALCQRCHLDYDRHIHKSNRYNNQFKNMGKLFDVPAISVDRPKKAP